MLNKKLLLILISILVIIGVCFGYSFYQNDIEDNGRVYQSKQRMCTDFAQSYLRTIQKTDKAKASSNIFSPEGQKWEIGIDVETDLYNLCLLDLNQESLKNYKSTVIEKYQK
ncbi:hypothetical protein GYA19_02960 [Candidatus Beckwithbacteria bacterium]|nr:hypothetical protein [Candidatus Beckwithbacteria bacterium]